MKITAYFGYRGVRLLAILAAIWVSPSAFANCWFNNGFYLQQNKLVLSPTNIIATSGNVAVGTVLATATVAASTGTFASCNGSNPYYYNINANNSITVAGLNNVFPTNIPGIGLRFFQINGDTRSYRFVTQGTAGGMSSDVTWGWYSLGWGGWGVDVVVTGPIGSGAFDGNLQANVTIGNLHVTNITVSPFTVTGRSCDASGTQRAVRLGTALLTDFPREGSTTPATNFSIELRGCYTNWLKTITYTLSASNGMMVGMPAGVIANYNGQVTMGRPAVAGIGVIVMDGAGKPVTFGNTVAVSFTPGVSSVSIPFKASMYRYGPISANQTGWLHANMTFTMDYK